MNNPTAEWIAGQVTDAFRRDEAQLRRVLKNYVRTHLSLRKDAPDFRRPQKVLPIAAYYQSSAVSIINTSIRPG
jgi:hypothetical protein